MKWGRGPVGAMSQRKSPWGEGPGRDLGSGGEQHVQRQKACLAGRLNWGKRTLDSGSAAFAWEVAFWEYH